MFFFISSEFFYFWKNSVWINLNKWWYHFKTFVDGATIPKKDESVFDEENEQYIEAAENYYADDED